MTFKMTSSSACLLVFVVVFMVSQTSAHQVRLGFNFKNSLPLGCLPRPNMTITPPPTPPPTTDNEVTCVRELTAVFKQQLNTLVGMHLAVWRSLHAECSPKAPFALFMYLFTKDMVKKLELSYFTCAQDIAYLLLLESQGYFDALVLDAAQNATLPPLPWQDAFNYGKTGRSTVGEDFNIESNVFFSNELTRALLIACLTTKPYLFKNDYDKIDEVIRNLLPGTNAALAALYDPTYRASETQMATISAWRAIAWADTTAMRPVLEPAQSRNTAETLQRSLSLKAATTGALTEADRLATCEKNPNPTDDYLASFFL